MKGREGQASPAFLVWCLALLSAFQFARSIGEHTRPDAPSIDCDHRAVDEVPAMERCLAVRPDDVELRLDLGSAYERAGRWDAAEQMYRQAVTLDPRDGEARVRLGGALLERGDTDGARREGLEAASLQPGRAAPLDLIRRAGGRGRGRD